MQSEETLKQMKNILKLGFLLFFINSFSQDTIKAVSVNYNPKLNTDGEYIDYAYGYSIQKPTWLNIKETGNPKLWGGTFPPLRGIENAVYITGFQKSEFTSFKDFQRIYITGNKFGEETLFSKNHIWYGRNERDFKKIKKGVSSRVFTFFKNKIYHNQFVLIETSKAYLFINFCSTPETYDENIVKFNEFLKGLHIE